MKPQGFIRAIFMQFSRSEFQVPEEPVLLLVDDVFALPDGDVKLFRQRFVTAAVYQSSLQDSSVPFAMDVLINQGADLAVRILDHFFLFLMRPVPWHMLHCRYPLFPPVLRVRFLVLV